MIAGPTASGKTALAIALAKEVGGEIISADSMQIYRNMDIGTAKPSLEEREGVPHHLIDIIEPDAPFSVVHFKERAEACIKAVLSRGRIPIIAGGTGLYINALAYNLTFSESTGNEAFRKEMQALALEKGSIFLYEKLKDVDPKGALAIHPNNVVRVIRALEVYEATQRPISEHREESRLVPPPYDYRLFALTLDRTVLYDRIEHRVDIMIEKGLFEEVRKLLNAGFSPELQSMQAIGYKECIAALENQISKEEAIAAIKLGTRHYAKRQITWFKKLEGINWLDSDKTDLRAMIKILTDNLNNPGSFSKMRAD